MRNQWKYISRTTIFPFRHSLLLITIKVGWDVLSSPCHPASTFGAGLLVAWGAYHMSCAAPTSEAHAGPSKSCREPTHPSPTATPSATSAYATARHEEEVCTTLSERGWRGIAVPAAVLWRGVAVSIPDPE